VKAPDQSTAYGRLWWALWDNYTHAEKKTIINAFAHELAEKIREPLSHEESMLIQQHVPLGKVLARRIDPEVST
jgi:hypothetical protein